MHDKRTPAQQQRIVKNPAGWPNEVLPLFERAFTCEFATLTQPGTPITFPLTPYIGEDERTLDVSTGLTYPAKAERARRNPKVGMLFSDAVGTGLIKAPVVLVHGLARVRDADLQANTDRYVRLSLAKLPAGFKGTPGFMLKRFPWYFARIWMEVTPLHIFWWPDGYTDKAPQPWKALEGTSAPPSDPAPTGKQPRAWKESPTAWREAAAHAVQKLGLPILTMVNGEGFPSPIRTKRATLTSEGFQLELPEGMPVEAMGDKGAACLTFHAHAEVFSWQENKAFVGEVTPHDGNVLFKVERRLADWSLAGSKLSATWSFLSSGRRLAPRLRAEAERRGQSVPEVHVPDFW